MQPNVEDLSTSDAVRYRVSVPIEAADGRILAAGIGEASTDEEKYRWRKPVCDEEFEETPAELRRLKWFRGREGGYQGKQVRTSPADLANTVLVAHKRAFVGGTPCSRRARPRSSIKTSKTSPRSCARTSSQTRASRRRRRR